MKKYLWSAALIAIPLWTLVLNVYHMGVFPPPVVIESAPATGAWLDRREYGINHMILKGPPYARGKLAGELTKHLLFAQEETLVSQLRAWVPSDILLQGMVLGAITWFQGVDRYFATADIQEMFGTSLSAPKAFDYLADGFTRQVAYHGLHEVGQMMVDQGFEDMGCTVAAIPIGGSFVLGRNFDFEGGRIFDTEKIVKWVFPEHGFAFVSVIWAGMVGAVTGVNEKGVYISINAAGSSDYRRIGTPSTLVLRKVLQEAANAEEALQILRREQMFITDIFVLLDPQGHLYRVEKSPARIAVIPLKGPSIVTNHLISPEFLNDKTNQFRVRELTSVVRQSRGNERLASLPLTKSPREVTQQILSVLRDKGVDAHGLQLNLGNRRAIDALIATHSVIYNPIEGWFYVGEGPAVAGAFRAYDLHASFAAQKPIEVAGLPADPLVSVATFNALKEANQKISKAHRLIRMKRCAEGLKLLQEIAPEWRGQSPYFHALGDGQACQGSKSEARASWARALALNPAYARFERQLESQEINP